MWVRRTLQYVLIVLLASMLFGWASHPASSKAWVILFIALFLPLGLFLWRFCVHACHRVLGPGRGVLSLRNAPQIGTDAAA
ncbi:MAG: hypothetical protein HQ523_05825 [Lentisphaerae bacterium]|nr:hypothetical protein [Lentisphaerota bacterium]